MDNTVLLVDDEQDIRDVVGSYLSDQGYDVHIAASGEEALTLFNKLNPPVVLTDIKMPVMDGIELLQKIKLENPEAEVVMITGHGDMDLAIKSLKYEATDFICKPIDVNALEIALRRAKEKIAIRNKLKEYTEELERLIEERTGKLVEAERLAAVGQTIAGLAHAIKNIAGGLTGGEFVLNKGIELHNEKYLVQGWDMIKGNVARIKDLALDLLGYSKPREPDYQLCDPNDPARQVFSLVLPRAREYDISLELDLAEKLPQAWIDPDGIHRCLLNLVTNAIDACIDIDCSTSQAKVVIRSRKAEPWAVEYQVLDKGCGMDDETKGKIFQSFFSTKGSKGTGLGLMITKKIIDEHNGEISFESEKDKGTVFVIRLPVI